MSRTTNPETHVHRCDGCGATTAPTRNKGAPSSWSELKLSFDAMSDSRFGHKTSLDLCSGCSLAVLGALDDRKEQSSITAVEPEVAA